IKHHQKQAHSTGAGHIQAWDAYITQGPMHWAKTHAPRLSGQGVKQIHQLWNRELKSSDPASHPDIQYLLWRRNLAPARFDERHPQLGKKLRDVMETPTSVPSVNQVSPPQAQELAPETPTSSTTAPGVLATTISPSTPSTPSTPSQTAPSTLSPIP